MEAERERPGSDLGSRTLRVRLLGGVDLRLGDAPVPPLESARAESLLAYLLLHRDAAQQRQRLAFMLWPDSTEQQARTNLRHVLHNLRRSLPEADRFIEVAPRTLRWRPDAPLWLDVAVFEGAVAEGRLEDAVEAYAGELLEGNYDDWLLEERERLAQLHLDALERLAHDLEGRRRYADAIGYAERLRRHDPLREESYRVLMRLHAAAGDTARALRVYHVCAATLHRELGIDPSPATRKAYEGLLSVATDPPSQQHAPATLAGPPLVGRTAERARLAALWRAAERGSAQLVLVTGEPGIGKSRLVEELRAWCARSGAATAEARAYPAEGGMAYGLVVAWLRSEPIASRLRRLPPVHLTELGRLLPDLLAELPDLPAPEPLPESEQRQRLFHAVARAILASGAPLLLIADDLQWCDAQTLQFIHYLLRAEHQARLLVAATARREEVDARHAMHDLVAALQTVGRVSEVALERLTREETGVLAERIAGRPLSTAEADRLYDDSEGNPLFVVEALRAVPEAASLPGTAVGSRVQAVIASRLARLSEPAAELVGVAATIGREFTTGLLAEASEADEPALVRALDELWRRGLVRAHGPSAYDFSHGKIREAAYLALSPAQRRHHHVRIARSLERRAGDGLDAVSGRVAAHYEAAGAPDVAIGWYVRAAEAAQRLHASQDAVRSLERALDLARGLPEGRERAELELRLLTALPAPLVAVEGYVSDRVVDVHRRGLGIARALEVEPEAPLVRSLALASLTRGDFHGASVFGETLRARGERDHDDVLWVEGAYVLGVAAYWQGRLDAARTHLEAAIARCRPEHRAAHLLRYGQDPELLCLTRLAHALWLVGDGDDAVQACETALALAEDRDPYSRAVVTVWAGVLALDQRDEQRLRRHVRQLATGSRAEPARQVRLPAEAFAGLVDVLEARTEQGLQRVRAALAASRGEPAAPGIDGILVRTLLEACWVAGKAEAGLAAVQEAFEIGGGTLLWEAEIRRLRAGFLAARGAERADVEAELIRAVAIARRQGARSFELRARDDLDRLRRGTLGGAVAERHTVDDAVRGRPEPMT